MMPSLLNVVTGTPSSSNSTLSTVENWVSVYTTWARRPNIAALPPSAAYSPDRSTVATPSSIDRPSSAVPSGIAVYIAGLADSSFSLGPASSSRMAAVATALVWGTSRSTGTRPPLPVKLPRK